MRMVRRLSIRNKLIAIILFVTILALGIGFTLIIASDIKSFKEDVKNYTTVTAQVIGDYCVSPLTFGDRGGAEQILAKLAAVPSIVDANVYDPNGALFAAFARSGDPAMISPPVREGSSEFSDNYLHVYQPIVYKDEYYGSIYLRASTQLLHAKIMDYLRDMVLLIAGLIIVSTFLAVRLQRIISQPILDLAAAARQIAEQKDYSIRVQKRGNDETGLLYDGFNAMVKQIQHRERERDEAEHALRESEGKFRTLTSNIPGAVYRCANDPDWTMAFISDVIEEISGYPASDFIQNSVRTYASIVYPDDRKMVEEAVQKSLSEHVPYIIEYRILRSEGSIRWVYEKGQGIFSDNGTLLWLDGAVFDITERKRAEEELEEYRDHLEELVERRTIELMEANTQLQQEVTDRKRVEGALRESEERFRTITSAAKDAILMMDDEGNISYWNEAAQGIFGYTAQEALGKELHLFLAPQRYHDAYRKSIRTFKVTGHGAAVGKTLELTALRRDGTEFPMELSVSAVKIKDRWHSIGILRDITERVRAEEELQNTHAQLAQSEKMASLGMLVAGVAHEINTPVGAISSMHDTLVRTVERLKSALDIPGAEVPNRHEKVHRLFKIIEDGNRVIVSGIERVINIVRRLRSFARLDEAELKKVDIHEGIEDTLTIVHHELKHKALVKRNFGDIPPIACYPGRLNQVYLNLLINAVQAIEDKGTITITTFQKDDHVHIQIKDTGMGIPKASLQKIFDPGVTTKGVGVGTGLGLSICYQIVTDHHGEIQVESEVGKGTVFTVVLPLDLDKRISDDSDRSNV